MIPIQAALPTLLKYCVIFQVYIVGETENRISTPFTTHAITFDDLKKSL
jgi:hypothetical protein